MPAKPSYRRPLNPKQLTILKYFYRFRFATTKLIAQTLNIPQRKAHQKLQILLDQDYIGRRDEAGFRLPGQFAVYYLRPKGLATLTGLPDDPRSAALRRRLSQDDNRSDRFIAHSLGVFEIYCQLRIVFGDHLRFFTKSDLASYNYFPAPLPDAYIRLGSGSGEQQFFLAYIGSSVPLKAAIARAQQFDEYADGDDWPAATRTPIPKAILVIEKPTLHKKLTKYIADELDANPLLQVASKGGVLSALERSSEL